MVISEYICSVGEVYNYVICGSRNETLSHMLKYDPSRILKEKYSIDVFEKKKIIDKYYIDFENMDFGCSQIISKDLLIELYGYRNEVVSINRAFRQEKQEIECDIQTVNKSIF